MLSTFCPSAAASFALAFFFEDFLDGVGAGGCSAAAIAAVASMAVAVPLSSKDFSFVLLGAFAADFADSLVARGAEDLDAVFGAGAIAAGLSVTRVVAADFFAVAAPGAAFCAVFAGLFAELFVAVFDGTALDVALGVAFVVAFGVAFGVAFATVDLAACFAFAGLFRVLAGAVAALAPAFGADLVLLLAVVLAVVLAGALATVLALALTLALTLGVAFTLGFAVFVAGAFLALATAGRLALFARALPDATRAAGLDLVGFLDVLLMGMPNRKYLRKIDCCRYQTARKTRRASAPENRKFYQIKGQIGSFD